MHTGLERLHASYAQLLMGRSAEALQIHPGGEYACWNARQIIEHLILTCQSSSAAFRERVAKGRPTQAQPTPYQRIQQIFVCRFGYLPAGRVAPREVTPSASAMEPCGGDALAERLRSSLQSMDEILVVCEERFGERRFATHQALGPLSARQWRAFHIAHGGRHLKQLRSLRLVRSPKESQIPGEN